MYNLPKGLSSPAQRALASIAVEHIEDFSSHTRYEIEILQGIGKNALRLIEEDMAEASIDFKDEENSKEVDEYIQEFSGELRERLTTIRTIMRGRMPKAKEKLSYGMPTYYYKENIIHFAGFKKHIGIFPTPGAVKKIQERLKDIKFSKGGIQLSLDEELPIKLIEDIIRFRMKEIEGMPIKA
jgi:uncharacterized protein YdhG (YjbR/CyaY superfamily)